MVRGKVRLTLFCGIVKFFQKNQRHTFLDNPGWIENLKLKSLIYPGSSGTCLKKKAKDIFENMMRSPSDF